ncbi:adenosine deaminase-like [Paramacrobiotus metropolitanus]|uniref:adenosine deaminase-like n=1 Tax=Paramacrobiotus metropolitanus TaxID=2943436 RepID=UPI00244649D0|nr:adenosine deaminase-like [Paramacrobiotus metropolitanus]
MIMTEMLEILRHIPKVELHCHLECAVQFTTLLDEHRRQGIPLPFTAEADLREYFLIEEPVDDFQRYLLAIERHQVIFGDVSAISRVAEETVISKAADNVKLFELRYSPTYMSRQTKGRLSQSTIHEAVKAGVTRGVAAALNNNQDIHVFLICCDHVIFKHSPWDADGFKDSVNFALHHRADFVGFDVACTEADMNPCSPFLDRLKDAGLGITVHAESDMEPEKIRFLVDRLHATRVGHGLHVPEDSAIFAYLKDKRIHMEEAPTANVRSGEVENLQNHPIQRYIQGGFSVSINSDDPGILDHTLTDEYHVLHHTFGYDMATFLKINLLALHSSFAAEDVKQKLLDLYFVRNLKTSVS